ncbi:motility associated factor glycosyltransferase family protein [Brevibacillus formosus]|uniref:motility associated factor glycosyltransferase family protein n=1 Tax=Brevibacillus formosus TaxID=54913 RepID=UPI002155D2E6|nr:6-hydroxymethylpterin diphosphokinase MptE-like protein [Brevibacillus formosus]
MIKIENVNSLKQHFPDVWGKIKDVQEDNTVKSEQTVSQEWTVSVMNNIGRGYIHSKYNPNKEAERFVETLEDIGERHVLFFGVGLGYHIDYLLQKHPKMTFSIYEPNVNVFYQFITRRNLDKWSPKKSLKNVMVETSNDDCRQYLSSFTSFLDQEVYIVILPSYERLFPEQTKLFIETFRNVVFRKTDYVVSGKIFAKRMATNGIFNIPKIVASPNLLEGHNGIFKNKPAILVAAGPSLNDEYDNLKKIKENGLAYIFSVGSSINALLANGITPDAAFSYDGSVMNSKVFQNIIDNEIDHIPLIFGSTIGFETLQKYPGKVANFIVSDDYIIDTFLKRKDGGTYTYINRFSSISTLTLQVLLNVGFSPVILVGQNFGYRADQYYAKGIDYINSDLVEEQKKTAVSTIDVYGNEIFSSRNHMAMKNEMESLIQQSGETNIINTTLGGAKIEGTDFIPMIEVINKYLRTPFVVKENWIDEIKDSISYDYDHLDKITRKMLDSYHELKVICKRFNELLEEMGRFTNTKNYKQLELCFNKFDKLFDRLQRNMLNIQIVQAMNHLEFQMIMKMFEEVRLSSDTVMKAKRVIDQFGTYLKGIAEDMEIVNHLLKDMSTRVGEVTQKEKAGVTIHVSQ